MAAVSCSHPAAVPVESVVTGQILAALCPTCGAQLPAGFLSCAHETTIDTTSMEERGPRRHCLGCGATWCEQEAGWPAAMF
ncbi:hypothetical protein GCM10009530_63590 [Microbispora corallina]|uniref:DUF2180 family protein n=1 Tax=Microbispora corallina TaxID=83302 RepID=A0ABQ4GBE5_9ACTN|nr:hypothetical protein [Microbispora corallina]GIH44411.1 hypothetical protein Mco01_74110 [Microbispora corallina]